MQLAGPVGRAVVGRAAAWAPTLLGGALLGFWDAERTDLLTKDGAGLVAAWVDTVSAYTPTQATDAAKPIWSATAFNGRPGITFDGADDTLALAPVPGTFPVGAALGEMWALGSQSALAADTTSRWAFAYGGSGTERRLGRAVTTGVNRARAQADATTATDTLVDLSGIHVLRGVFGATSTSVAADGQTATSAAVVPATGTTQIRIGNGATANGRWQGVLNALFVIDTAHANWTADNQARLLAWMKVRGGIA